MGQNFLVDVNLQRKIVDAFAPTLDGAVLEIGPGRGALTRHVVGRVSRLILVEKDDQLAAELEREYAADPRVFVHNRDILDVPLTDLAPDPSRLRVLGNIPYNVTTPILFHLLVTPRPAEILIMVQREVGERLLALPGTREYGALTVGVRTIARVERVLQVPRTAFRPVPRVDSMMVRFVPTRPRLLESEEEVALRRLTRALFQWRRKQLQKTLRDHPDLSLGREGVEALGAVTALGLRQRPERLSPEEFVELSRALRSVRPTYRPNG